MVKLCSVDIMTKWNRPTLALLHGVAVTPAAVGAKGNNADVGTPHSPPLADPKPGLEVVPGQSASWFPIEYRNGTLPAKGAIMSAKKSHPAKKPSA
jgi:hypothetical protein